MGRRWRAGAAGVALLAACRQLVGIGDAPPAASADASTGEAAVDGGGGESGAKCGLSYVGASCEACLESACCEKASACSGDPACGPLERCLGACGDTGCRANCESAHLIGANPPETDLATCLVAQCAQPCALGCGDVAAVYDWADVDAAAGCEQCITDNACSLETACASDPACLAQIQCMQTNHVQDRVQACWNKYDAAAGQPVWGPLFSAMRTSCLADCAIGGQWGCVGNLAPPVPSGAPTNMALYLYDFLNSQQPVANASVQLCEPLDPTCTTSSSDPLVVTGQDGTATVSVPAPFDLPGPTGYLSITGQGLYPTLFFWGYPLSEPEVDTSISILTPGEAQLAADSASVSLDPSRGHVLVVVNDCSSWFAPGVQLAVSSADSDGGAVTDGETVLVYLTANGVSRTADSTDATGRGGFLNVLAPRTIQVTATPKVLGSPAITVSAYTKPGTITIVAAVTH